MNTRHEGIEAARALACLMVVAIHVAAPTVSAGPQTPGWAAANILDGAARWSVPVFFMLSGWAYFQDRAPKAHAFGRLVCALLFYSFLAMGLQSMAFGKMPSLEFLWAKPAYYHLWYFYVALAVYGIMATFRLRTDAPRWALLALAAAPLVLNPQIPLPLFDEGTGNLFQLGKGLSLYLCYAFLGVIFATLWPGVDAARTAVGVGLFLAGIAWTITATHYASVEANAYVSAHYGYGALGPMVAAYGVFLAALSAPRLPAWLSSAARFTSRRSLAVYGLHPFALAAVGMAIPLHGLTPTALALVLLVVVATSMLLASLLIRLDPKGWVS